MLANRLPEREASRRSDLAHATADKNFGSGKKAKTEQELGRMRSENKPLGIPTLARDELETTQMQKTNSD